MSMPRPRSQNYEFTVPSCLPGRIRWRVPSLVDDEAQCSNVCDALGHVPGALTVKISSLTGSIVFTHTLPWDRVELSGLLAGILQKLARNDPQAFTPGPKTAFEQVPIPGSGKFTQQGLTGELRKHPKLAWKAFSATFLDRLFEASPPALISLAVDSVTRQEQSTLAGWGLGDVPLQLRSLVAAGAGLWIADSAVGYYRSVAASELALAVQQRLRDELYQHFQTLDLAQIESEVPGYWESVFRDDANQVSHYLEQGLDPLVTIVANTVIVFVQLLRASVPLAMLQLLMLPGLYLVSKWLLPAMRNRRTAAHKSNARLTNLLRSNVQGISTIASFAREGDEARHVACVGAEAARMNRNSFLLSAAYVPLIQLMVGVGFLGTLAISGMLVHRRRMVTGQLSMIGYSSLRLLTALGYLGVSVDNYQKASLSMQRIEDFRARTPQMKTGSQPLLPSSVHGELKLDRVTFAYPNEPPLFKDLNMTFPAGKTIGLVGLTGAGKSTLLKVLLRYYDIQAGDIRLDGQSLQELRIQDLRRAMAYVPQQPFIFPGTVRENIAYSRPGASDSEVIAAAKLASAHDFIEHLQDGYGTVVRGAGTGGLGKALSGGQAQRLAIARAVLADTPVILFDEATSAVDNETESAIQQSLHDFSTGRTTIVVAHRLSTVRRADWIYVLDEGAVREAGTHDELVALDGIYAGFWRVQTGEATPKHGTVATRKATVAQPEADKNTASRQSAKAKKTQKRKQPAKQVAMPQSVNPKSAAKSGKLLKSAASKTAKVKSAPAPIRSKKKPKRS